jgi:GTP-binding protein EngB required for normal cell division
VESLVGYCNIVYKQNHCSKTVGYIESGRTSQQPGVTQSAVLYDIASSSSVVLQP